MKNREANQEIFREEYSEHMKAMERLFQAGYLTLRGQLNASAEVRWTSNAFDGASLCAVREEDIWNAYQRLTERLDIEGDPDFEIIIEGMRDIQEELCREMFHAGMKVCATYPDFWERYMSLHKFQESLDYYID